MKTDPLPRAVRVLHLEDQRTDTELVKRELGRAGLSAEIRVACSEAGFRDELAKLLPDVILSDFAMPGFDGMHALRLARELCPDIPFVFVSGTIGEEYAIRALKNGATDYVLKTNLVRLPSAVERALRDALERAELREAERAREQSDAALRRAQLMAGLAHVITGADGAFESWSETLREMIGVPSAGMPRNTREWLEFVHPDDRALFRARAIDAQRTSARVEFEYRLRHAGGSWLHVRQVSELLDGKAAAPGNLRWFGTLQDVTEQKRAEEDLRRFRLALDNSADIILIIDRATMRHVDANAAATRLLGYTHEELLELGPQDMLPFGRSTLEKTYDDLIANPSRRGGMRSYYRCKDGSEFPFESTRHVLRSGDSWLIAVISRDIRDRLAAEEALRASEERHRAMFEQAAVGIVHGTLDGRVQLANPKFCDMVGYTRAEAMQLTIRELTHPEDAEGSVRGRESLLSEGGAPYERELRLLRKDGSELWVHVTTSLVRTGDGRPSYFISVVDDISERKRATEALRESEERFRSLGKLSSDWFWQTDAEHRFVDTPARVTEITGMRANAYVGKRRWEVEGLVPVSGSWDEHKRVLERRETYRDLEVVQTKRDGSRTYLQVSGEPTFDQEGRFSGYRGTAKDITGQKRASQVLALEHGVARQLADAHSVDEGMQTVMRLVCESESWEFCRYWQVDEPGGVLRFDQAWCVPGAEDAVAVDASREMVFAPGVGLVGRVWQSGEALWVPDLSRDERVVRIDMSRALGMRGAFVFPVIAEGATIGVLAFSSREIREPDDRLFAAVRVIGGQIGQFLRRKQDEERIQRLNRVYAVLSGINAVSVRARSREELFGEACRIAVENGQFRMAWIGIVDRQKQQVRPVAWQGADEDYIRKMPVGLTDTGPQGRGLAGRAVVERTSVTVEDLTQDPRILLKGEARERGFRSLVMLPLIVAEEAVGVLALYAGEAGFFDDEEMKLLHELAGDIAFTLDHLEKSSKLDYLAYYDSLTGLANRSLLLERLAQRMRAAGPDAGKLALVVADIERLRTVNDSLGRQAGDAVIRELAARLSRVADPSELARTSADHFVIVVPAVKGRSEAARRAERVLHQVLAEPFNVAQTELRIAARAGIALFPNDGLDAETLLRNAEAALRKAKDSGERHLFYTAALTERTAEQLSLENRLRQALEKQEFVLHYQPKVDIETRRIVGIEGLIRWQSPELGLVPPGKFIPLMEETGLILEAGSWALRRAALDHRAWVEQKLRVPRVAVNVSAIQLRQRGFVGEVEQAIMEGVAPTGIDLEITESLLMEDVEANIRKLKEVRGLGVSIAIDDFGTGYSSLSYLAKLPVQTLKIDRSFIVTMLTDPATMTLVQTMISLAHSLRLKVVAEGVELEEQAKMLRLLRCDELQGYLFSKPVPFAELTEMLKKEAAGR